jgi:RNA polymerase sigma-70 factor (ECF subfamily)
MNGLISERDVSERKISLGDGSKVASPVGFAAWSDENLLAEFCDHGDRTAFEELVHRYERELFGYLRNYLGDADLAEDVFQQTFLRVYLKSDQFSNDRKFRPWLYAVATNQAIDSRRRTVRQKMASLDRQVTGDDDAAGGSFGDLFGDACDTPAEESEMLEQRAAIRDAVDELPEQTRQVVLLVYFQGLKYREAAEALGVPVGTVKSRLHGAIQKLSEVFVESAD